MVVSLKASEPRCRLRMALAAGIGSPEVGLTTARTMEAASFELETSSAPAPLSKSSSSGTSR